MCLGILDPMKVKCPVSYDRREDAREKQGALVGIKTLILLVAEIHQGKHKTGRKESQQHE